MTDFTTLRDSINALTSVITTTYTDMLRTANADKEQLAAIYKRLDEDRADILEFGKTLGDLAATLNSTNDNCGEIASKITETMLTGMDYLPVANYEDFVDFCSVCGEEICVGDEYEDTGMWTVCADCHRREMDETDPEPLDNPEEPETHTPVTSDEE